MDKESRAVFRFVYKIVIVFAIGLSACGLGSESSAGNAANGETIFKSLCAACHGQDATGIPSLGKDLVNSEFTDGLSDQEFVDFIIEGRSTSDPANTTDEEMPPRGGNPDLTEQDLADVVAYLRTLSE